MLCPGRLPAGTCQPTVAAVATTGDRMVPTLYARYSIAPQDSNRH